MLTAISTKAENFRSTGSLNMGAPGGMLVEPLPENVRILSDAATILPSLDAKAM
jgi:hypothetical protein